jgi:hypothetical protein
MGDIADAMLNGELCEGCGVHLPGEAPGHPRYCSKQCRADRTPPVAQLKPKEKCTVCGRKVKPGGLANHMKDAHSPVPKYYEPSGRS